MMIKLTLAATFGVLIVWTAPSPAMAHRATSFDACVGSFYGVCKDHALYLAGDHPHVVAVVRPHHADGRAILWRRAPHRSWERVTSVAISDRGRMSWQWDTTLKDV